VAANSGNGGHPSGSRRQQVWGTDAYAALWDKAKALGQLQEQEHEHQAQGRLQGAREQGQGSAAEGESAGARQPAAGDGGASVQQAPPTSRSAQEPLRAGATADRPLPGGCWSGGSSDSEDDPLACFSLTSYGQSARPARRGGSGGRRAAQRQREGQEEEGEGEEEGAPSGEPAGGEGGEGNGVVEVGAGAGGREADGQQEGQGGGAVHKVGGSAGVLLIDLYELD
jgi:hypothetical protein